MWAAACDPAGLLDAERRSASLQVFVELVGSHAGMMLDSHFRVKLAAMRYFSGRKKP
jgi:hypothetical protein